MSCYFKFDESLCTACGACAVACMDQNDINLEIGQKSFRQVRKEEKDGQIRCLSTACLHCSEAPCIRVCSPKCIYRDEETGLVLYNNKSCLGCRACASACPHDGIRFRESVSGRTRMEKCDGCYGRVVSGLQPACVLNCPTGALTCTQ